MSKNKEPQVETIHLDKKDDEVSDIYTDTALGITKNPLTGLWEVVEFKFNALNGKVKLEKRHEQTDRYEALAQFRVMASQKVLVN